MKGIVFDLKRFAVHDGPGIRTTVFLKGCPLNCVWCQNPESRNIKPEEFHSSNRNPKYSRRIDNEKVIIGMEKDSEELLSEIKKDIMFYEESGGGVTFSGGECLIQHKFLKEMLEKCRENDIHTAVDTTGFASKEVMQEIAGYTDLFLYDIKILNREKHIKYTGVDNKVILENFEYLYNSDKRIKARIPLIPGITDDDENLKEIANYLLQFEKIESIDLLPFNEISISKTKRLGLEIKINDMKTQSDERLNEIIKIFEKHKTKINIRG